MLAAQEVIARYSWHIGCSIEELAQKVTNIARRKCANATVSYRVKSVDTLTWKMRKYGCSTFGDTYQIHDIYGIKILVDTVDEVYMVKNYLFPWLGGWVGNDYIAKPKTKPDMPGRAYRAIQLKCIHGTSLNESWLFEVQITTREFNRENNRSHAGYHLRKYGNLMEKVS